MSGLEETVLVAVGAAAGAVLRFLAGQALDGRVPWGTLLVNVAGSFLLGALVAASVGPGWSALLGVGFCGGLTTYSALAVQTHDRGLVGGSAYAVATVVLSLAACALAVALVSP